MSTRSSAAFSVERRALLGLILCGPALVLPRGPAHAQQAPADIALVEGKNYRLIGPHPVADPARIEVIDFFFYGCPYCRELLPLLDEWRKAQPGDVLFRHAPVVRRDTWMPLARTYFTLEALGEVERLHAEVFRGYHVEELHLSTPSVMADWAARHGLDRARWTEVYTSDAVSAKVEEARRATAAYDIQGTPSVAVDGRFLTSSGMNNSVPRVVPVVQKLVDWARRERNR